MYTPAEAAFYSRVRTQTLNRWLFGSKHGDRVIFPEAGDDDRVVTFLDFVQSLAIRSIRNTFKIPLQKIRQTVDLARTQGVEYPFAVEHSTYLFGDENAPGHGDLVLRIGDDLLQASGRSKGNYVMREIAELYMRDLHFSPETGLADRYVAWADRDGAKITMDPRFRFGEPVIESCGFTARTLWEAYEIEGGIDQAAEAFGIDRSQIELALSYYDHLISNTSA